MATGTLAPKIPTPFEKKQEATKQYVESLQGQVQQAEKAPAALRQAAVDAIAQTRAQTGKVLSQGRGLQGGGRGLMLLSQAAQDRGLAEGAQRAQYEEKIQGALAQAAQARSEALAEQAKAAELEMSRGSNAQAAASQAEADWQTAMDNVTIFTDADAAKVRNALYAKAAQEPDPQVAAAIREVADRRYKEETEWQ